MVNLFAVIMSNRILNDFEFKAMTLNIFVGKHKKNEKNFCVLKISGCIIECFFLDKSDGYYVLNDYKNVGWYFKSNNARKLIESFIVKDTILVRFYHHGVVAEEEYDKINYDTMKISDLELSSLINLKFDNIRLSFDLHREDGPAYIEYDYDGGIFKESYFQNGRCFRKEDLPCYIKYDINGNVVEEIYYKDGVIHRDNDLPAKIVRTENGRIQTVSWFTDGVIGRKNGPAEIERYDNNISFYFYDSEKLLHCERNAAIVVIKKDYIIRKEYMLNGKNCGELEKAVIQSMEPDDEVLTEYLLGEAKKVGF